MLNLAERLCASTGSDQAYLLNSGSEACEAAIKLARKWGQLHRGGASRIIVASKAVTAAVWRRCPRQTVATCTTASTAAAGFQQGAVQRLPALHAAVDAQTVAIMLEPIQSDAGVIPATEHYLKGVERLCRELGILLILDEVQTGIGAAAPCSPNSPTACAPISSCSARAWAVVCRWRRCWPGQGLL
jgi:acetylornithine/N-succinyldiaminopimelate aminotransferase